MAGIDFNQLIQERLSRSNTRGSVPFRQKSLIRQQSFQQILKSLRPQEQLPPISSEFVGKATGELEGANPEEEGGFSFLNSLMAPLDILGRPVRDLIGAATAAVGGNFEQAGRRALDAALSPIDALTFDLLDVTGKANDALGKGKNGVGAFGTTGSEILDDLGWKAGTTTEDERRIRIAMAAGLSRRDAMKKFAVGDNALSAEEAASFENLVKEARKRNPNIELGATGDDFKNAVDAQDFAGFAVDVLTDPLTYMSAGLTAAGKGAKAVGIIAKEAPHLAAAIRAAKTAEEAASVIRSSKLAAPQAKRLTRVVTNAFKAVKEGERPSFYLADNWAKQTREGQRAFLVSIGGKPLVKGGPVSEVLSTIGQTKIAEEVLGKPEVGAFVQRTLDMPGVSHAVGAARGVIRFMRDKFDTETGVRALDELLQTRDVGLRENLTKYGRVLNEAEVKLREVAKGAAVGIDNKKVAEELATKRLDQLKKVFSEAVELSKTTGGDFEQAVRAGELATGIATTVLERKAIAPLAAGIVRINEDMLARGLQAPTRLTELTDESLQYLRHSLTKEGRAYFKEIKNRQAFLKDTGLEFNARSSTFAARSNEFHGKTIREINEVYRAKHGIDLFNTDPIAATRESVRLSQRGLANAKFVSAVTDINQFGSLQDNVVQFVDDVVAEVPPELLNQRQIAKDAYEVQKARNEVLRKARKTDPALQGKPSIVDPVEPNWATIPEGPDSLKVANWFKSKLKEEGHLVPGQVSAFDLYHTAGLRLPSDPQEIGRLVATTVPEEIGSLVARSVALQKDPTPFLKAFDKVQQWLKSTVTVLFPAFHGRNFLENMFKNTVEGNVNPNNYRNAAKLLGQAADLNAGSPDWVGKIANKAKRLFAKAGPPTDKVMRLLEQNGIGKDFNEIADWLVAHGILDNRITSEFGEVLQDGVAGTNRAARVARGLGGAVAKELGTEGAAIRAGFALSAGTENLHRVSLFLDRLNKGYLPAEAAAEVKRVFFDYRALTSFESEKMRRGGYFYAFYRNNVRYIVGEAYRRPALTKQIGKLFQSDPDNPRQKWLSDKASFAAGAREIALGFLPQQQFNMFNLVEGDVFDKLNDKALEFIGQGNPIITAPLQAVFNKDLFTGGQLMQPTNSVDWSFAPDSVKDLIGYEVTPQGEHKINGYFNALFKFFPVLGRFSASSLELTDKERTYWQKLAKLGAGIQIQDRDFLKEDLALIDRNLMRAKAGLNLIGRNKHGAYVVKTNTEKGKLLSAMAEPSKDKMRDLALSHEVFFTLKPYMTFDSKGEIIATEPFKRKLHELAVQMFPKEMAFLQGNDLRKLVTQQLREREGNQIEEKAALNFDLFNQQ